MKLTTVLFDLDGTLLPMDQEEFTRGYFGLLTQKAAPRGYDPKQLVDGIWAGTAAMVKNDGSQTNEAVFWRKFAQIFGQEALKDKDALLSVSVNAAALTGAGDSSGQTAALLGQYADRVYVLGAETPGACDEALAAAGLTGNAVVYVDREADDLSTTGKLVTGS